jgi:uncharacterized protein YbcV (DUF1398 family)
MFTEQQLTAAHSKVKTGADFPKYIKEIKALGLISYTFMVTDGAIIYNGAKGHEVRSMAKYPPLTINKNSSAETLYYNITIHQQGQTDFLTFCKQAAQTGVQKWVIDTNTMFCTYYNIAGNKMLAEPIPQDEY